MYLRLKLCVDYIFALISISIHFRYQTSENLPVYLVVFFFFCLFFLIVVERKNERTVLEHPLCRAGTRCQYVSNKEDSRLGGKRDPGGLTRRALAAVLRYCLASIIDSFCRLCCMDVLVTY